ncbi:hypothetical protein LZ023_07955 [Pseudomonas silvicola]|uniref:hypothetical protein n=1 Tax=Pseudomonas sp. RIT-To-2 TaxID=3462541 RepID=UPI00227D135B|nr:hypothetical protein LZ023_07955 [Pseudomonas silvicola]
MSISELVSTGAIALIAAILLILLMQYLRLRELWELARDCQKGARWARIHAMENRELRRTLRAEKARIIELKQALARLQHTELAS